MKGLFVKDLCLMKMQKKFFAVIVFLALVMAFASKDISFVIGYLTLITPMFAVSTVSYDEFDGGNAFLFTLPVSRRLYVAEKYLFASLLGVLGLLAAILISFIADAEGAKDAVIASPAFLAVMMLIISAMLPLQLKFGAEKGRVAFIILGGSILLLGFGASKLFDVMHIDIYSALDALTDTNFGILIGAGVGTVAVLAVISIIISMTIMKKKEF